jgi:hypothetical protein
MISVIVSTIGAPFAAEHLCTIPRDLGEVIVVIDMVGRAAAPQLERTYPLAQFYRDVDKAVPGASIVQYAPAPGKWAVQNGCYNVGVRAAQYPWFLCTHDDVKWNTAYPYAERMRAVLHWLMHQRVYAPLDVAGFVLPEWETVNRVMVPEDAPPHPAWCQVVSPVSHILHRHVWDTLGGFDEVFGVWYDGQLEAETPRHNWKYLYLPVAPLRHQANMTYRVNNWGNRWKANPIWNHYARNYERKYGTPPGPRKLSGWYGTVEGLPWVP